MIRIGDKMFTRYKRANGCNAPLYYLTHNTIIFHCAACDGTTSTHPQGDMGEHVYDIGLDRDEWSHILEIMST